MLELVLRCTKPAIDSVYFLNLKKKYLYRERNCIKEYKLVYISIRHIPKWVILTYCSIASYCGDNPDTLLNNALLTYRSIASNCSDNPVTLLSDPLYDVSIQNKTRHQF